MHSKYFDISVIFIIFGLNFVNAIFTTPITTTKSKATVTTTTTTAAVGTITNKPGKKFNPQETRILHCREGCLEKFAIKNPICRQRSECSMCWDDCAKPPLPSLKKANKSILETWKLRTVTMVQQDSLVLVDVAWNPFAAPNQCLVTWEVSGGGLMGNLLTESSNVQLSLWPDTKYRVQVTCKNKKTDIMSRSLPLSIDTAEASITNNHNQQTLSHSTPTVIIEKLWNFSENEDDISDELPEFPDKKHFVFTMNKPINDVTVNKIESSNHPNLNLMTIITISNMQKPLIFGVITGTLLLAIILVLYICILRKQHRSSDKRALIEDDGNNYFSHTNYFGNGLNDSTNCLASEPSSLTNHNSRTLHVLTV